MTGPVALPSVRGRPLSLAGTASWRIAFAASALLVGFLYTWFAKAVNPPWDWKHDKVEMYDLLGRAFARGHLYLPLDPPAELLALPDPWDPANNQKFGFRDMVLYGRRLYLYHGAAPAVMLFTPWRLIAKRDLPESFAVLLFCMLGYLFSAATLLEFLSLFGIRPRIAFLSLLLLALGLSTPALYLLNRAAVYEVAISAGYFCTAAGFFFLTRAAGDAASSIAPAGLAGLMLGLAIGCRPNLLFAGVLGWILLFAGMWKGRPKGRSKLIAFTVPLAVCVLAIMAYNYRRFQDPFEFGMKYELAAANYRGPRPALENMTPGLYYLLLSPPQCQAVFPFWQIAYRMPFDDMDWRLPSRYFLEPITGAFAACPAIVLAFAAALLRRRNRAGFAIVAAIVAAAICVVLFVASLGLVSHRFEMDYASELLLASCVVALALKPSPARTTALAALFLYGIAVNLSFGFEGPYWTIARERPRTFVGVARWFSPVARFRPLFDPRIAIDASFEFTRPFSGRMPLVTAGAYGSRYRLSVEMIGNGRARLVSALSTVPDAAAEVPLKTDAPNRLILDYDRASGVTIRWNGELALHQQTGDLITAPAQVEVGEDHSGLDAWVVRFPGKVSIAVNDVKPAS